MNTLLLAVCLTADPIPLTLYEFERNLDAAITQLRFARYVAKTDRSLAIAILWTGKSETQLDDPKLVLFRPNQKVRTIVLHDEGKKVLGEIKPPPKPDVLLDEPLDSECGRWLTELLKGFDSMSEEGELHAFGAPTWKLLATKHADRGQFRNSKMDKPAEYRVQADYFEQFVEKAKGLTPPKLIPPEEAKYAFGKRGIAIRLSETKILLSLEDFWDKLKIGSVLMDGYREVVLDDWFAKKIGKETDNKTDFGDLVITAPKPAIDPLIPLIKP